MGTIPSSIYLGNPNPGLKVTPLQGVCGKSSGQSNLFLPVAMRVMLCTCGTERPEIQLCKEHGREEISKQVKVKALSMLKKSYMNIACFVV